ncbi:MAG TPA: DUF6644 family protein [Tepidisphaeraceae bacterium]
MPSLLGLFQWMAATSVSVDIRESIWAYPVIESVHVLGITIFMGLLLLWDCRLLGVTLRRQPVTQVWKQLIPWITLGGILMAVSGGLLFWSDPVRFYGNVFFRVKVVGLLLAAGNAAMFHIGVERRIADWELSLIGMFLTGIPLLASLAATKYYFNEPFRWKMYFLAAAILFTFTIRRFVVMSDETRIHSAVAKTTAIISVLLWSGVGIMGRGIGFY